MPGAEEIDKALPGGMRAWRAQNELWIRTPDVLISPAPVAMLGSDLRAYQTTYLPVISIVRGGQVMEVALQ